MSHATRRKKRSAKRVLTLPDLGHAKIAVVNSLTSASGQRIYEHAIREFVAWYWSEPRLAFNRTVVLRYRIHPSSATMRRPPSIYDSRPSGASRTKRRTPGSSARNSPPAFAA